MTSSGASTASHVRTRNVDARFSASVASNAATNQYNTTNGNGNPTGGNPSTGGNPPTGGNPGTGRHTGAPGTPGTPSTPGTTGTPGAPGTPGATQVNTTLNAACGTAIQQTLTALAYTSGSLFTTRMNAAQTTAYNLEVQYAGIGASSTSSGCPAILSVSKTGWVQFPFVCLRTTDCADKADLSNTLPQVVSNVTKLVTTNMDPTAFTVRAGRLGRVWMHVNKKGAKLLKKKGDLGSKITLHTTVGTKKLALKVIVLLHQTNRTFAPKNNTAPKIYG